MNKVLMFARKALMMVLFALMMFCITMMLVMLMFGWVVPFFGTLVCMTVGLTGDTTIISALVTCVVPTMGIAAVAVIITVKLIWAAWRVLSKFMLKKEDCGA